MDKSEMVEVFKKMMKEPTRLCLICEQPENPFSDIADTGKAWLCGKCKRALRSFVESGEPKIRSNASLLNSMQICLNVDRDSNCLSECFGCDYINRKEHIMDMMRDAKTAIENLTCELAEEHNARLDAEEKAERPVGQWLIGSDNPRTYGRIRTMCGRCRQFALYDLVNVDRFEEKLSNFCPNCGAQLDRGGQ